MPGGRGWPARSPRADAPSAARPPDTRSTAGVRECRNQPTASREPPETRTSPGAIPRPQPERPARGWFLWGWLPRAPWARSYRLALGRWAFVLEEHPWAHTRPTLLFESFLSILSSRTNPGSLPRTVQ